jgi:hypothetical protein
MSPICKDQDQQDVYLILDEIFLSSKDIKVTLNFSSQYRKLADLQQDIINIMDLV